MSCCLDAAFPNLRCPCRHLHAHPAGDRAAVDAQRALHLRIAEATRCLKNGVLVENDEGAVARYLAEHPELAVQLGTAAQQQQAQQQAQQQQQQQQHAG